MSNKIQYAFTSTIWQYQGPGGWHFVSLPVEMAEEIRANLQWQEEGWGRLKASAKIGQTEWDTAIWFDTKHKTYILPLKAEVRKQEKLLPGQNVQVLIRL